jgi:hypothetical protein
MPSLKSVKWGVLLGVLLCLSCSARGEQNNIRFLEKNVRSNEQGLFLDAVVALRLSAEAEKALKSGVPLVWAMTVRVWRQREILWDKKIAEVISRYQISYHALMDVYRIKNEQSGTEKKFTSLQVALNEMGILNNIFITADRSIFSKKHYIFGVLFALDKERLPLPLRPVAYYDSEWMLTSQWYLWSFQK